MLTKKKKNEALIRNNFEWKNKTFFSVGTWNIYKDFMLVKNTKGKINLLKYSAKLKVHLLYMNV